MKIRNQRRKGNFTILPNEALRNPTLSLRAKGLLAIMLSCPDDWIYYLSWLETQSRDGRETHRATMVELVQAGYVTRRKTRGERGRFSGWYYVVSDSPTDGFTEVGETDVGETDFGETATTKKDLTKTECTKNTYQGEKSFYYGESHNEYMRDDEELV